MPYKVFISYSEKDSDKRTILQKALKRQQTIFTPVVLTSKNEPAKSLSDKVIKYMDDSNVFVPILTYNSISNQWVNQEIGYAFSKSQLMKLPIVEESILSGLKGFIHNQMDLPFKYKENDIKDFKSCCTRAIKYLKEELKPKAIKKEINIPPKINVNKISELLKSMYQEYRLFDTQLLDPKAPNTYIENHSHGPNGYFTWLNNTKTQRYSFKYWDHKKPINFVVMNINHLTNKIDIVCQLDSGRSGAFLKELAERLK